MRKELEQHQEAQARLQAEKRKAFEAAEKEKAETRQYNYLRMMKERGFNEWRFKDAPSISVKNIASAPSYKAASALSLANAPSSASASTWRPNIWKERKSYYWKDGPRSW